MVRGGSVIPAACMIGGMQENNAGVELDDEMDVPLFSTTTGCTASPLHLSTLCPNVYTALVHHTSPTKHLNCSSLPFCLGICSTSGNRPKAEHLHLPYLSISTPAPANSYGRVSAPTHNTSGSITKAEHLHLPHLSISNPPPCTAPANSYGRGSAPTHNIPGRRSSAEHPNLPHLFSTIDLDLFGITKLVITVGFHFVWRWVQPLCIYSVPKIHYRGSHKNTLYSPQFETSEVLQQNLP